MRTCHASRMKPSSDLHRCLDDSMSPENCALVTRRALSIFTASRLGNALDNRLNLIKFGIAQVFQVHMLMRVLDGRHAWRVIRRGLVISIERLHQKIDELVLVRV